MLVPIPLGDVILMKQLSQNIQLVVKVVEDNHLWMIFKYLEYRLLPGLVRIYNTPPHLTELAGISHRRVRIRVPSPLCAFSIERDVVIHKYIFVVLYSVSLELHVYEDALFQAFQMRRVQISVYLRELYSRIIDDVPSLELCLRSIEAVCNENWNIIFPLISRSSREEYPVVFSGNIVERLHPSARPDNTLLVKYKECSAGFSVLLNVIPAINDNSMIIYGELWVRGYEKR